MHDYNQKIPQFRKPAVIRKEDLFQISVCNGCCEGQHYPTLEGNKHSHFTAKNVDRIYG